MAQQKTVRFIDDIDGSEGARSITFAWDGKVYDIDLSTENIEKAAEFLKPYIAAGRAARRKNGSVTKPVRGVTSGPDGQPYDSEAVRAWGKENGYAVADRGRVSKKLVAAYVEAQRAGQISA